MNKKGFTLVELLAVIAILGMLIAMVTPNLMDMFEEKKDTLYENTISEIERVASIYLTDNPDIYSDISKNGYVNISIDTLCNEKYLTCPVKNQKDNSDIDGYVKVTYENNNYVYRFVNNNYVNENVKLEVYLNGGILSNNINGTYKEGTIIELKNPTKVNGNFKGWKVVKGNSTIIDNKLTIGSRDTIIYAQWEAISILTIDLNGGTGNTTYNGKHKAGTLIELEEPTKEGYLFLGWEVIEGDSILSGNKLTIGNINSKVKALWKFNKYNLIVELNGGTTNQQFTEKYEAGITIELENPTKEGYTFTGWSTDNGIVSGTIFTMGSTETTITANWKANTYIVTLNANGGEFNSVTYTEPKNYEFTASEKADYKLEAWGAQGGSYSDIYHGGYGSYVSGVISLNIQEKLYIYVGGKGDDTSSGNGGYNGGANGVAEGNYKGYPGGGATDIRYFGNYVVSDEDLVWNSTIGLNSRILVAAGGGGAGYHTTPYYSNGGNAGGLIGYPGTSTHEGSNNLPNAGGTQISGGYNDYTDGLQNEVSGGFGYGGAGTRGSSYGNSGGGAGYYGGSGGPEGLQPGGGGSSYISGHTGAVAITSSSDRTARTGENGLLCTTGTTDNLCSVHYSGKVFSDTIIIDGAGYTWTNEKNSTIGVNLMPNISGKYYDIGSGNVGNGAAKISQVTDNVNVVYNNVYGKLPTPTREGYVFFGWYTKPTEGEKVDENTVYDVVGNQTIYAHWKKIEFVYTGDYQTFEVPHSGYYKIEVWGASGGNSTSTTGGKGAYSSGKIYMNKGENLYLYLGGSTTTLTGGYNGGGTAGDYYNARGGGGASDVRYFGSYQPSESDLIWNSTIGLNSRIMVSGGGGGADNYSSGSNGGVGGTLVGGDGSYYRSDGSSSTYTVSKGGTQSAGGASGSGASSNEPGSFGQGGSSNNSHGGGGGAGYYGGGAGSYNSSVVGSGAGGSSFISGYAGVNTITSSTDRTHTNNTLHYSNKYFIDGEMQAGVNLGNGKAKITYLGNTIEKKNDKLNNVRYIKDCVNGQSKGEYNHWIEIQAIYNGQNVSKGKNIAGTSNYFDEARSYTYVVDGIIDNSTEISGHGCASSTGLQCVTVDLESTYNLDEIVVWHYWNDGRSYNNHSLYVSSDNTNWTTLIDNVSGVTETSNGIRVSAYD